jgi:hypothetical protein
MGGKVSALDSPKSIPATRLREVRLNLAGIALGGDFLWQEAVNKI